MNSVHTVKVLQTVRRSPPPPPPPPLLPLRAVPSGGQGAAPPRYLCKKVALFSSRCPFLMPNHHHQQGALLKSDPPPSNFRLRTAMPICARDTFKASYASYNVTLADLQENIVKTCEGHMERVPLTDKAAMLYEIDRQKFPTRDKLSCPVYTFFRLLVQWKLCV